jgi:hypothetical protein
MRSLAAAAPLVFFQPAFPSFRRISGIFASPIDKAFGHDADRCPARSESPRPAYRGLNFVCLTERHRPHRTSIEGRLVMNKPLAMFRDAEGRMWTYLCYNPVCRWPQATTPNFLLDHRQGLRPREGPGLDEPSRHQLRERVDRGRTTWAFAPGPYSVRRP